MTLTTTYFGPIAWYRQLYQATLLSPSLEGRAGVGSSPEVFIEACESYQKQTHRNRCTIATANGPQNLTVPVVKGPRCIRDIEISDHGNWRHLHWQALQTAYGESAFFEYYQDDIRPFYEKRWKYLLDFNNAITETMCRLLDIDVTLRMTGQWTPTPPLPPTDAAPYYQVYRQRYGFLPNLSILDLLFNEGPQAILYLANTP